MEGIRNKVTRMTNLQMIGILHQVRRDSPHKTRILRAFAKATPNAATQANGSIFPARCAAAPPPHPGHERCRLGAALAYHLAIKYHFFAAVFGERVMRESNSAVRVVVFREALMVHRALSANLPKSGRATLRKESLSSIRFVQARG